MPDSKITALTSISTSTDPANDPLVIVDVSDTSMAASGTTKKVTLNQLLGASGTATLASATISGDLTVDTNVLKVDTTLNRVGIGTASPSVAADVVGSSAGATLEVLRLQNSGSGVNTKTRLNFYAASTNYGAITGGFGASSPELIFDINTSSGAFIWNNFGSEAMRLNSSGLGVGGGPFFKIQSIGLIAATDATYNGSGGASGTLIGALLNNDAANPGLDLRRWQGSGSNHGTTYISTNVLGDTLFYNGAVATNTRATSLKMTLDASGNLDLAVGNLKVSNGKGIDFSATPSGSGTMTSELLSDYEEGTWTGTLKGSVSDPTTPVTATGRYTKIGRVVSIQIDFGAFNSTGASGNATITGLPFANGLLSCGSVESGAALTFSGTLAADVSTGGTTIQLQSITSNNFALFATHNAGNPRYLTVTLTYTV